MTLMEGSGLDEKDLIRARAESSSAILLLGDRFSSNVYKEDMRIMFQVPPTSGPSDPMGC